MSNFNLKQIPDREVEWPIATLTAVMRMAIPPEDIGSRGAIQYAREIAEFFWIFGIEIKPGPKFNAINFASGLKEVDDHDTSLKQ